MTACERFDVAVVGGGHAGIEAALAAARIGAATVLLTFDLDGIGKMSCNPAIGGIAKGHLVREVDALCGEMGRAIDATGIQFRVLNSSKGPAVRASRAQADRIAYSRHMKRAVFAQPGLKVVQEEVVALLVGKGEVAGVVGRSGTLYHASSVVVATGTFLNGLIHVGLERFPAGRTNDPPSVLFAESLKSAGIAFARLKTGTPPRLAASTIDWARLPAQHGDPDPAPFSVDTASIDCEQLPCHLTYTNPATHGIIRSSLDRSPLYSGVIRGVGPRYCPSIEDKVMRFGERERHQVFLEPEGRDSGEVYPNGISTSLPLDVQKAIVRSIEGLERAEIVRPGYAVEYDAVDPLDLYPTLESKAVGGLFLAGQINRTSGYEEAAAQGIIAGINAARKAGEKGAIIVGRHEGYMGVMVDDLTTTGASEPYRMFTSRAEFRLLLREDNAEARLARVADEAGVLTAERRTAFARRLKAADELRSWLRSTNAQPSPELNGYLAALGTSPITEPARIAELLKRPGVTSDGLKRFAEGWPEIDRRVGESVEVEVKYEGYIRREVETIGRMGKLETLRIPESLDWTEVSGLPEETRQALARARPMTLGQAQRLQGMSPAAAAVILIHLRKMGAA